MMRGPGDSLLFGALLTVVACQPSLDEGSSRPAGDGVEVSDSMGTRLVINHRPAWSESAGWAIEPDPLWEIGQLDGPAPYTFSAIGSVTRLSDGRIVVVESTLREIRIFDSTGQHLASFGGAGAGPGEFGVAPTLAVAPGDTLLTWDRGPGSLRYSWFLPDGSLIREARYEPGAVVAFLGGRSYGDSWTLLADGTLFFVDGVRPPLTPPGRAGPGGTRLSAPRGIVRDGARRVFFVSDVWQEVHVLAGEYPAGQSVLAEDGSTAYNILAPVASFAAERSPLRAHVSTPGAWEVRTFTSDGALDRIVRLTIPLRALSRDLIEARVEAYLPTYLNRGLADEYHRRFDYPEHVPPISRMYVDRVGNLWLADNTDNTDHLLSRYQVLDPSGRWLGQVETPADWGSIREIGEDYILTTRFDEFRVPYLRLYRLLKGP